MSGGSYDYFYSKGSDLVRSASLTVGHMAEQCFERVEERRPEKNYRTGESVDLEALATCAQQLAGIAVELKTASELLERWKGVLQAVEWWRSGDWGVSDVVEEFEKLQKVEP